MDPSKPISLAKPCENFENEENVQKRTLQERGSSSYNGPVIQNEEFRAGFPILAKLPIEVEIPSDEHKDIWGLCGSWTAAALQDTGLDFDEITLQMMRGQDGTLFHPTILIILSSNNQRPLWQPTLVAIGKMLYEEDALDMHVLITTPRGLEDQSSHAYSIASDHPLVKLWPEKIAGPVLDALESVEFNELCVWNWGVTEEAAEPTVVIVVNDKQKRQEHEWDALVRHISALCAENGAPDIKVVVTEGRQY